MKKILFILLCFVTICVQAQDVIVKKDGSIIQSKVLEVNETNIKYKKQSNQNGPTYTIGIKDVLAINYANGDKDTFDSATTKGSAAQTEDVGELAINMVQPDSHNAELIARYNKPIRINEKETKSRAKWGFTFLGVDENSVLSSNDVEINFVQEPYAEDECYWGFLDKFFVQIHNKLDSPIYVDLGNTFRVLSNGEAKVYFDGSQSTTISRGSESGGSVNLGAIAGAFGIGGALGTLAGGVNVGGETLGTTSKTYSRQRVIAIPPHGKVPVEKYKQVHVKGSRYETIAESEDLSLPTSTEPNPPVNVGAIRLYDRESSPHTAQYTITYSHSENFSDVNVVKVKIYVKEVVGTRVSKIDKCRWNSSNEKLQKNMKKIFPDYGDEYLIIGHYGRY